MPRPYMSRLMFASQTPWNALQSRKLSSARSLQADCRAAPRPAWSRSTPGTTEVCAFNGQLATPLTLRMQPPFRPVTRPAASPQSATLRETARGASGDTETCADRVSSETFGSQGTIPVRRPPVGPTPRICRGLATPGPGSGPVSREARPPRRAGPSTDRRAPLQRALDNWFETLRPSRRSSLRQGSGAADQGSVGPAVAGHRCRQRRTLLLRCPAL